jgi:hypothetical protein
MSVQSLVKPPAIQLSPQAGKSVYVRLLALHAAKSHQDFSRYQKTKNPFSFRGTGCLALAGMFRVPRKLMSNRH